MFLEGDEKKLKIIISESEVIYQRNLYEAIIFAAKKYTMAGVTATKGFLGFGADGPKNANRGLNFSTEPPITIEIVDREERIEDFSKVVSSLLDKANASGIVYIESVNVVCFRKQEDAEASANHI